MSNRKHKTVIITGAANGLGKALAFQFYKLGYNLALIDTDNVGLQSLQNGLINSNQKVTIHELDISDEQRVITTRADIFNTHQRIDILINNAAVSNSQTFEQVDLADYKILYDTNFWGTIYCTKYFLPDLKNQDDSRLVNIISDFALMGFPGKTTYGSSKSAVMGFTNSLKTELADTNVKVCLVVPPPLNTGIVKNGKHIDETKRENEAAFLQKNSMPLDKAAKRITKQIENGKYRIVVGAMMFWIDLISRIFPTTLHNFIGKYKKRVDFV
jgi:short-subunit dehydrogenase